ncbi:transglycosylase SLT domain-containing protein [Streptomyces sp. NPDC093085]|uniref:transglycosylase SLT domain-containing protein n=1 Tax=Streptomyces sp. NPDC093085 TaxID=3155068 RepID=UPI003438FD1D
MFSSRTPGLSRLNKTHKASIAGVAAAGAAALTLTLVPGGHSSEATPEAQAKSSAAHVAWNSATNGKQASTVQTIIAKQHTNALDGVAKVKSDSGAKAKAEAERGTSGAASRSAVRKPMYPNNLDGWIRESLAIMKKHGIPGTYNGIHRNIMRESSGNPKAINLWDINARNGIPSKGLLQVIPPTFKAYHVKGTKFDIYNPVSNIVAACNYAADKYGSMDNVNSAY